MPPKAAKKENLDDLKQELDIDYHKITPEELYQRFQTHPENVSTILKIDLSVVKLTVDALSGFVA